MMEQRVVQATYGVLGEVPFLPMPIGSQATLGQVWSDYCARTGTVSGYLGNSPTKVRLSYFEEDEQGEALYVEQGHVYVPGSGVSWAVPWALLRIDLLQFLYPTPLMPPDESADLHVSWTPAYRGMGNGPGGPDWSQLPELFDIVRQNWPAVAAYLSARGAVDTVSKDAKAVWGLLRRAADKAVDYWGGWASRGASVTVVWSVLADDRLSDEMKAEMLGIPMEDVPALQALFCPKGAGISEEIYPGPSALLGLHQIRDALTEAPPTMHACACGKVWCTVRGGMVPTATGVKVGLDGNSDHFILDKTAVEDFEVAVKKWRDAAP